MLIFLVVPEWEEQGVVVMSPWCRSLPNKDGDCVTTRLLTDIRRNPECSAEFCGAVEDFEALLVRCMVGGVVG
jgi:hypothetical protein